MFTSRVPAHPARRRSPIAPAPFIALTLLVVSCGGDDAGSTSDSSAEITAAAGPTGAVEPAADAAEPTDRADGDTTSGPGTASDPEISEITGVEDLAGAIGGEELTNAIDALGIDTRMKVIADQLDGTNDSSAFLYVDGDATTNGMTVCFIVSAVSSPGDVVVVAYPNGDVVCD